MRCDGTVFVVDDEPEMCNALTSLCRSIGMRIESFGAAEEFLERFDDLEARSRPACVVLDVRMEGMSGLELQRELAHRSFDVPVIFMTGYGEVSVAVEAMLRGAVDFLEKPFSHHVMLNRIESAIRSDRRATEVRAGVTATLDAIERLTPREREVMHLFVDGKYAKEIAHELDISPKTVDTHRAHILEKFGARSLTQIIRMVVEAGLTSRETSVPLGEAVEAA